MGDESIARSGLGDELNFIPTEKHSLMAIGYENIFVIGDATSLPSSKAGSVAHSGRYSFENFMSVIEGRNQKHPLTGMLIASLSQVLVGILIDFNYDTEPLPENSTARSRSVSLLEETKMNHYGKIMFRWAYWNFLLKGLELPIESNMSMAGKSVIWKIRK
jgi:sulfide:quinone oxidoreductase